MHSHNIQDAFWPWQGSQSKGLHKEIFKLMPTILYIGSNTGQPKDRSTKDLNALIKKLTSWLITDKLCTITLLKADINFAISKLWQKHLLTNGQQTNGFCVNQWAAKKKQNIKVVVVSLLTYQLAYLARTVFGTFSNDAKACHNQVVTN